MFVFLRITTPNQTQSSAARIAETTTARVGDADGAQEHGEALGRHDGHRAGEGADEDVDQQVVRPEVRVQATQWRAEQ